MKYVISQLDAGFVVADRGGRSYYPSTFSTDKDKVRRELLSMNMQHKYSQILDMFDTAKAQGLIDQSDELHDWLC